MRHATFHHRKSSVLFWTAAILTFLLLSVAATLRADSDLLPAKASRVATWNASGDVKTVSIENVNGEVKVVAGDKVAATVEITAHGRTDAQAKKALDQTKTLFSNDSGDVSMAIEPPGTTVRRSGRHGWSVHADDHDAWSVSARWSVTVPANLGVEVSTVNGAVTTTGVAGDLKLSSVNGRVTFAGAKGSVKVDTVNGAVDGTMAALPASASIKAEAVNGSITLHLPKSAAFRLSAHTMGGEVLSTFPLPAARDVKGEDFEGAREKVRADREKVRAKASKERVELRERRRHDGDVETIEIDMRELDRSMAELDREMAEMSRNLSKNILFNLNRSYEGTVGGGGASVKVSNMNGKIVVLQEGTREADAKPLVGGRTARVVTIPPAPRSPHAGSPVPPNPPEPPTRIVVRVPRVPRVPQVHVVPGDDDEEEASVVQGDVQGDFLTTLPMGDVTVGKVSGKVRISTHAGEIHVERAGAGADLKSLGGDVTVGSVTGDLKATTLGGNLEAGAVTGDARLETQGGDVTVRSCDGSATVHTGGGDIHLGKVKGPVEASTSGGSIDCEIASAAPKGGSRLETSGGDVTLTLPANVRATVEVVVHGVDPDTHPIVSEFPEIAIERGRSRASAGGKLNGGGPSVTVISTSGTVTLKKGPAA